LGQTNDYKIDICRFSPKHPTLGVRTKTDRLIVLVWYKMDVIIISLKCNLFLSWCNWWIAHLVLSNNCFYSCVENTCMTASF